MSNTADIDAFIKSVRGEHEAPTVRLMGRDWKIAAEIPIIVRMVLAKVAEPDEVVSLEEEEALLKALVGVKQYEEMVSLGLTPLGVTGLLVTALAYYSGMDPQDALNAAAGNVPEAEKSDGETPAPKARKSRKPRS